VSLLRLLGPALLALALAGCTFGRKVEVSHEKPDEKPLVFVPPAYHPSFDCLEAASIAQDEVCGSKILSGLDEAMAASYRRAIRNSDLIGSSQLASLQAHWLIDRRTACALPAGRRKDQPADPAAEACLQALYRERIARLDAWPKPVRAAGRGHPIGAYVSFQGADYRDPLCAPVQQLLEESIQRNGDVDPHHLSGAAELASTHGDAAALGLPFRLAVTAYKGDADKSYELRAQTLSIDGQPVVDQAIFGAWIRQQPNSGGRFFVAISDSKDFAALDAIRYQGRLFALAVEPWGYFSPASIGEASYAGLFEILGPGRAEPRCLYKTYSRPPARGAFDALPSLTQLRALLVTLQGEAPADYDPNDRRAAHLLAEARLWHDLNLPLIGTGEELQDGWAGWLRKRHDATWDALFAWSERDLGSKTLYRQLIDLMAPAGTELAQTFRDAQGLSPAEARDAADLALMELIEQHLGTYPGSEAAEAENPRALATYRPRFAVAPKPGDIEAGRPIASLHSAALNGAGDALGDFIRYEYGQLGHARSRGADGETALMAAAGNPATANLLLSAGADPNETDAAHRTALMTAARLDQLDTAQRLLDAGADPERATIAWTGTGPEGTAMPASAVTQGETALMIAADHARPALIRLLLDHGARPQDRDGNGGTACDRLAGNFRLEPADRTALAALLCR